MNNVRSAFYVLAWYRIRADASSSLNRRRRARPALGSLYYVALARAELDLELLALAFCSAREIFGISSIE